MPQRQPDEHEAWREQAASCVRECVRHREKNEAAIAVIIAARQGSERAVTCLDRLRQQEGIGLERLEVIVADDGALDSERELLPLRVDVELRLAPGTDRSHARNAAVLESTAPLLAFVDAEGLLDNGYFARALSYFDDESVLGVRGRIVANRRGYLASVSPDYDAGLERFDDFIVSPHSSLLRREAFLEVRGFESENEPWEAFNTAYRIRQHFPEGRLVYAPDVLIHRDGAVGWRELPRLLLADDPSSLPDLGLRQYVHEAQKKLRKHGPGRVDQHLARHLLQGAQQATRQWARWRRRVRGTADE